jgi:hypothetical protein
MLDRMKNRALAIGFLVTLLPVSAARAQFRSDFNANNDCGVTATMSHDGTKCLWFQEAGPGYGCDASRISVATFATFAGLGLNAMFEVDIKVGWWGGSFGMAYDTNRDTLIRGNQPGER